LDTGPQKNFKAEAIQEIIEIYKKNLGRQKRVWKILSTVLSLSKEREPNFETFATTSFTVRKIYLSSKEVNPGVSSRTQFHIHIIVPWNKFNCNIKFLSFTLW